METTETPAPDNQPAVDLLPAGAPANPTEAAAVAARALAGLPGGGAAPVVQDAPPPATVAPQATNAPAYVPVDSAASTRVYEYGDEYPPGLHYMPDGRTLRKLPTGMWQDPDSKAFVKSPLPRPKRKRGRPRKDELLTGPISTTAPGAPPMRRQVTAGTFAGGSGTPVQPAIPQPQPAGAPLPTPEELQAQVRNAVEVTATVGGKLAGKWFGPEWTIDTAEAETLADVWAPIIARKMTPEQQAASPLLVALVATLGVFGPKVIASIEADKLRKADTETAAVTNA